MEYCEDSPKKKKRRKNPCQEKSIKRCIIHTWEDADEPVTSFSEHSWEVSFCVIKFDKFYLIVSVWIATNVF